MDNWKRSLHTAERDVNLEPSEQSTPSEALNTYRPRATVEHLVHSLKRVAGLEPLRVWKEDSIGDAILSALLAETTIAMAGYEMETRKETKVGKEVRTGMPSSHRIHGMVVEPFDSYPFDRGGEGQEGSFQ